MRLLVLLMCGCTAAALPVEDHSKVTSLRFTAWSKIADNPPPPIDITVDDAVRAQTIFDLTMSLPHPADPPPVVDCPIDLGIEYRMLFFGIDMIGNLEAGGCETGALSNGARFLTTDDYWAALAQLLEIPEAEIHR